jgi:hypothetical protein
MTIVLAHRMRGFHALLEMALRDERARPRPDDRTIAGIKKKKLAIKDQLEGLAGGRTSSAAR